MKKIIVRISIDEIAITKSDGFNYEDIALYYIENNMIPLVALTLICSYINRGYKIHQI